MNFKIFPYTVSADKQKIPLFKGWYELASNDQNQIKLWCELYRDRIHGWGIPTGGANGIVALDIDVKEVNGWNSIQSFGYVIPNTLRQDTPSGGSHFIFAAVPNVHYGNSVNKTLGLDVRGERGWIAYYGFVNQEGLSEPPIWLPDLARGRQNLQQQNQQSVIGLSPEIVQQRFEQYLDNIRNAAPGERNDTLNREAFKIGQLVESSQMSREFATQAIIEAATACGLPIFEINATLNSGLNGGSSKPLTCPFPDTPPQPIASTVPLMPEVAERWTPRYFTKDDLLNTSKLRKPQLFKDWSTEDIQIITADGGTGKTTLKLFEAICLALGDRFLGFECMQRGKTLFITGEDTDKKLGAMLGAIMKQMNLFDGSQGNEERIQTILGSIVIKKDSDLCLIVQDRQGFLHPNPIAMDKIMQAVSDIKPKMIVFDPIASFWGSESKLNDMNKAVTRFMSDLVDRSGACVEMINHMGKSSSANKDMTQFAGRGGSGLPSHSRVSKVLRYLPPEEFSELTGGQLVADQTALYCNVNKFSDGSPLFNKPFVIIRDGYLFSRLAIAPMKAMEMQRKLSDKERIFKFIKDARSKNKYPTEHVIAGHFSQDADPISRERIKFALAGLTFESHLGEMVKAIDHPDATISQKAYVITDPEGREL